MDFEDSEDEANYRAVVRTWLEANVPNDANGKHRRGVEGSESLRSARSWQARKASAGYACIHWPREWGGPAGTPIQSVIFHQEESKFVTPPNPFHIGLNMSVPTVLAFSDQKTRERFGFSAMNGDEIWCQLFSEPSGGSDLAAARTRVRKTQDGTGDWIINGQKVWTSFAHIADFGLILCRSNTDAPKHNGLTMFWVDLRSQGVEVRPIHEMNGSSTFNEVFFTDVRISDNQRLGPVDGGWKVAVQTLMNERLQSDSSGADWIDVLKMARRLPSIYGKSALQNPAVRQQLAQWYIQSEGLKHTRNRVITALSRGHTPGPENSIMKLVRASQMQDLSHAAIEIMGRFGVVDEAGGPEERSLFQDSLMWAPGLRIAGGTDEILRNIIAERVLRLPRDASHDKS
ncbi:acyl-CoA dehydrogenase family protein [Bradyrhizobium diazoefficiens]|jgi:alkylation response protein AidB-like acyl-CoA dehydrogenase|nr:acyl-CoA dehydrogenase family protein [Bradyrhizobium diazoefficiens]MBR0967368.1 acyl-CoA dehydrogenase family protein [Bradyrhizobium diazoefficiens]MBR0976689.1 acyl-CoA dehydrogenase family protein [Bradyrhizobium diazoefficiens]MBR1005334.1 acyl-CoA dehydrogenase family protein [Bradyrhizobium diazoefficiens]MBR1011807.1 acyl-CoA dehydrogenase family protein [Bradyrhizobium diazoefficiens]MBR1049148.1 acyl-CoA dehydrogenase family protein [Bradyrhizobium diazoefficiens]